MGNLDCIRVMAVDDHELLQMGIKFLLLAFDDLKLVSQAYSGEEALRLCPHVQPDVILMDIVMPGMDGIATTRAIRERYPHIQVIILSGYQHKELVQRAIEAGAIGYLVKDAPIDDIARAIRSAYAGRPAYAPEVFKALIGATNPAPKQLDELTERQRDVISLVAEGLSNTEIALRLSLRPSTVRHHVSEILSRLCAANRAEAAAIAVRYGLIKPSRTALESQPQLSDSHRLLMVEPSELFWRAALEEMH